MLTFLLTAFGQWLKSTHLTELSVWIAQTPLSVALSQNSWVTPTVQSIHILAIAVTFGSALMINLRILGRGNPTGDLDEADRGGGDGDVDLEGGGHRPRLQPSDSR